jgi:tetratricopeptide (TPR) repeat protein
MSNYQDHINLALALHMSRRYAEAATEFEQAATFGSLEHESRLKLAQCHAALGSSEKAIPLYQEALQSEPESLQILNALGDLCYQMERFDEAAGYFERSLAVNPRQGETAFKLGFLFEQKGRHEDAGACYDKALEANPKQSAVIKVAAALQMKLGKSGRAAELYRQALLVNPGDTAAAAGLSAALDAKGDSKGAREMLEHYSASVPQDLESKKRLAWLSVKQGEHAKAAALFRELLGSGVPAESAEGHGIQAWLFTQEGQPEQALEEYLKGLGLEPANVPLLEGAATLCYKRGDFVNALSFLERLSGAKPDHVEALSRMGSIYLKTGRREKALAAWEAALAADPDNVVVKNNLRVLKG